MNRSGIITMFVGAALILGGCGAEPSYSVGPEVNISTAGDSVHIDGSVLLAGQYGDDLRVEGLRIEIWQEGSMTRTVDLGSLSQGQPRANFSLVVPSRPDEIRVRFHEVSPPDYDGTVYNLEWQSDDKIYAEVPADTPKLTAEPSTQEGRLEQPAQ